MTLLNPARPPNTVRADRVQAVVFDWAGTLVDFGSVAPARTLQTLFAGLGITLTERETRQDMGLPKKEHIRAILTLPRIREAWRDVRGGTPNDSEVDELYAKFVPMQLSCLAEHSAVIPGVIETVSLLRRNGIQIGSTTGYTRAMLNLLLQQSAASGYSPDCSLCPEDVGAGRPHPFMIYECAVRLRVAPLSAIVKVGDTPADIREGLNAGCWSVGVAGTGNGIGLSFEQFQQLSSSERDTRTAEARAELRLAGAHYVIDSLGDIPSILDNINACLQSAY